MVATPLQDPRLTPLAIFDRTVLKNPYIFHDPTPKQAKFLMCPHREARSLRSETTLSSSGAHVSGW